MSNEPKNTPTEGAAQSQASADAWQEVGKQFQTLGESLATAVRTAWNDEQNRKRMHEMQTGLESMVNDVARAIRETADSPQGQQFKSDAKKAAESFRNAGEQTAQEVRPHLVSALRQLNDELQKMIGRMEQPKPGEPPADSTSTK